MHGEYYSVLIADDNEIDRYFLKRAIKISGSHLKVVCELRDGEEVVAYLSGREPYSDRTLYPLPDLLILDTRMPRMDGLNVLRWLQTQEFYDLKVAMFADSSGTNLQAKALADGAAFFFSKIVHEPELIRIVQTLQGELDRGRKRTQVLLQHRFSRCYLQAVDRWTPLLHQGLQFESVEAAADFACAQGLAEVVHIALSFHANGQIFYFPVTNTMQAKISDELPG